MKKAYLSSIFVEYQCFDIISMSLQLHHFGTRSRVPHPQYAFRGPAHNNSSGGIHGQTVNGVLIAIETRRGHRVIGGRQGR